MRKLFLLLLLFVSLLYSNQVFGQTINGMILSATDSMPISGAAIKILRMDSTFIKGYISNADGSFSLQIPKNNQVKVIISYIGFSTSEIQLKGINGNTNVGKVFLSEDTKKLGEVVVKANNIINTVNKSIIYLNSIQLKVSNSSLDLLKNLNLPGLYVDAIEQKVNINGSQPVYMINGVSKTLHEILTVNPQSIARIEYESSASIRYADKNVGGVINIILKQKEDGGSFYGNVFGSPQTGFLNSDIYSSYNWGKSEVSVNYFNDWRDYKHRWTDKNEEFISENKTIDRNFVGVNSPFGYLTQGVYLNYSYQPNNNMMFYATFKNDFGNQHTSINGNITEQPTMLSYFRDSKSLFRSYAPALDLFLKKRLKNNQSLEINIVGTLQNNHYDRNLKDSVAPYTTEMNNKIHNLHKSVISEIVYIKSFKKIYFNLGYQNKISYTKNIYTDNSAVERLHQNNNYAYGSMSGSINKFSYNIGTGIKIFSVKNDLDNKVYIKNHSMLSVMYALNDNFNIKLSSFYTPNIPGLSQLSNVTQKYDDILYIKGNPDLKAASTLGSKLYANYEKGNFSSNLTVGLQRQINTLYLDVEPSANNTFISEPRNGVGDNNFNVEYKCSYSGLLNHINLYSTVGYNSFTSEGENFKHHLNNFYWDFTAQVYYGKWTLNGFYVKPKKTLMAQILDLGENNSLISLQYKHQNLSLFAAVKYPFATNGWQWSQKDLSKVNPNTTSVYIKDNSRMILLGVTYSLDYGKKLRKLNKNLNNVDTSTNMLKVQE